MDKRPIGVFDSGLGGLTCVKQIHKVMPSESIVYLGDTGRVPYGTRSAETIIKYAKQDIEFLLSNNVKCIVVACGTVSSVALPVIAENYNIPIIGVIDCTSKKAEYISKNKKIGVLGTSATIKSNAYEKAINAINPYADIFSVPCPLFVPLVENGYIDAENTITTLVAKQYLSLLPKETDTIILGCTHYPLLKGCLSLIRPDVTFIDSGLEAALELDKYLNSNNLNTDETTGKTKYYVTDTTDNFAHLGSLFLGSKIIDSVERVEIQ